MLTCGRVEWAQVDLHGQQVDEALEKLDAHLKRLGELCHPGGVLLQARIDLMDLTCKICSCSPTPNTVLQCSAYVRPAEPYNS